MDRSKYQGRHRTQPHMTLRRAAPIVLGLLIAMTGVAWAVVPPATTNDAAVFRQICEAAQQGNLSSSDRTWAQRCARVGREAERILAQASSSPTPSVSSSPTLPPSPTPSPTPTLSPTPTPNPTGTLTNCFPKLAACGYRHPGNTGVPVGTTLTPLASTEIRTAGTVIDGRLINGFLTVRAPNVVIRNSKIVMGNNFFGINVEGAGSSATIEDTEIDCVGHTGVGIDGDNYIARRVHIHGCENGFHTGAFIVSNVLIEDSYITDLGEVNGGHADGIQGDSGSNVTVRHNTFDILNPITSSIIWDHLTISNALIENNFFAAGAFTVYCPTGGTNITYRNNRFYGPVGNWQSDPHRPAFGFSTGCGRSGITWTGNFRDDTLGVVNAS